VLLVELLLVRQLEAPAVVASRQALLLAAA
jgi:hypothetical protein